MNVLRAYCYAVVLPLVAIGCQTGQLASRAPSQTAVAAPQPTPPVVAISRSEPRHSAYTVVPASAIESQESLPFPAASAAAGLVPSQEELVGDVLTREWLQAEVEARNPSLAAMVAAWQAAAQRYPQAIALDDPILAGTIAPQSAASDLTETAYAFQLNQKLPWFGKRPLRGAIAAANADAASNEVEDSRLQIRLAADLAFFEYFYAARLIEINRENTRIAQEFLDTAQARYRANQVTNQDVLQAELDLADLARRRLELARMQQVAIARINTLLRVWPDAPLPAPPPSLEPPGQLADPNLLWQTALRQRPDLAALAWRVQSEEAALELAYKNLHPDADVFGRYDTFWQPASTQGPLRAQVGVAINLPIYREKLWAAINEAQFRLNQRRAEFDQRALDIQYDVVSAAQQVEESRKSVELYSQRIIPAAEQNVAAARANYEVNKLTFIELAVAERQLFSIRERQIEAIIAYHRRVAELNRVTGGLVTPSP